VVRPGSAKALCAGSIPARASSHPIRMTALRSPQPKAGSTPGKPTALVAKDGDSPAAPRLHPPPGFWLTGHLAGRAFAMRKVPCACSAITEGYDISLKGEGGHYPRSTQRPAPRRPREPRRGVPRRLRKTISALIIRPAAGSPRAHGRQIERRRSSWRSTRPSPGTEGQMGGLTAYFGLSRDYGKRPKKQRGSKHRSSFKRLSTSILPGDRRSSTYVQGP
jgi:hypothetical protein